jgi:GNAT superfamily N-acetyltransferase
MEIRPLGSDDRDWLDGLLREVTAGPSMVSRGRVHDGHALPGLVAVRHGERAGVALYRVDDTECEVVFLAATVDGTGAGTALLDAVAELASTKGCRRAWVITTNANTAAIRFYQRRSWDLVALHRDAITAARELKPGIPEATGDGIPLRHELEFERRL